MSHHHSFLYHLSFKEIFPQSFPSVINKYSVAIDRDRGRGQEKGDRGGESVELGLRGKDVEGEDGKERKPGEG